MITYSTDTKQTHAAKNMEPEVKEGEISLSLCFSHVCHALHVEQEVLL